VSAVSNEQTPLRVALAGNPNAGKTSIFNVLTGSRQHVGNYPGVTVEKRWGNFTSKGRRIDVADLPGTYSLTAFSPEERVARDELLRGNHDVVVLVADSTSLKRSLMLLVQVLQLGAMPVLCLNMADEAAQSGQKVDIKRMEKLLGFPVVETEGHKGIGRDELIEAIHAAAASESNPHPPILGEALDAVLLKLGKELSLPDELKASGPWLATRLLVGDEGVANMLGADPELLALATAEGQELEEQSGQDPALLVTEGYFAFVHGLLQEVVETASRGDAQAQTESIDQILVHKWLGLPIFALFMYGIFWLTFTVGEYPMDWIEGGFQALGDWVEGQWPEGSESPLKSLIVDGAIAGVGGVVIFLPNIILLFFGLALLEDTGYMARAAFLMDRVMNRFGLHGKSFVPMLSGFGCSIPGIMATRTLENERDRLTTMMVLPLMSCGARLTIWMLLIPAFFSPAWRAPALWLIYCIGILLALLIALLLRKSLLKGEEAPFVMELPPYRLPTPAAVIKKISERAWIYLRKAGTIILGVSILLWFLTAYPKKDVYDVDLQIAAGTVSLTEAEIDKARGGEDLQYSVAGRIGKAMEPYIEPMGFDYKLGTSMLGAFAAKEVFVAQMGIVYSMGDVDEENVDLRDRLARDYSPLVGFSLMLFLLISTPCMATFAVTKRESGSWKWAFLQLGGLTGIAYVISTLVYQIGSRL
jgi:ferrous iron transport protein B